MAANKKIDIPIYIKKIYRAYWDGTLKPIPGMVIHVQHDDDCQIFTGGPCTCDPDIYYEVKNNDKK
jgi:hypothetical protein